MNFVLAALVVQRRSQSAGIFSLLLVAIGLWALLQSAESLFADTALRITLAQWQYLAIGSIPVLWYVFTHSLFPGKGYVSRRQVGALSVIPALTVLLVMTNDSHHLIWASVEKIPDSCRLMYAKGPAFWLFWLFTQSLLLAGVVRMARELLPRALVYRRQFWGVFLGLGAPWIGNIIYLMDPEWMGALRGMDLTPVGFSLTALSSAWVLYRRDFLDLTPIARDALVEEARDGVLAVDLSHRVVDINPSARRLLGLPPHVVGQELSHALRFHPALCEYLLTVSPQQEAVARTFEASNHCWIEARITPLCANYSEPVGRLIILRDVTETQQMMAELQRVNDQLRSHLHYTLALQTRLHEQAFRDELTGLYNRRFLMESLTRNVGSLWETCSVILIDLDHFKTVNDRWGHTAGDTLLRNFAELVSRTLPRDGFACRYGGEEFIVVLPEVSLMTACVLADQLRESTAGASLLPDYPQLRITLSAGIGGFGVTGNTIDEVLSAADAALYHVKHTGRNRVSIADRTGPSTVPGYSASAPVTIAGPF
ncbi:MAG: histidine kinase N-terminal 7TM domain-containing protein [Armatimonadaceae bacterium]